MASTSDPVVVILDDEPSPGLEKEVPRRLSEAGASASHAAAERRRKQKRKLVSLSFLSLFLSRYCFFFFFFFFFSVCMGTHEWAAKNLRADARDGHLTPPFCGPSRTNADPADPVASGGRGLNVDFAAKKSGVPGVADRFDGEEAQGAKGGAQFLRAQDDPAGRLHCGVPEDPPGPPEEQRPGVQDLHERDAGARCHAMRVSDRSPLTTPFPPVVIPPARLGLVLTQRPLSSPKARVLPRVSDDGNEGEEAVPGLQEGHKEHEAGQEALPVGSTSPVLPPKPRVLYHIYLSSSHLPSSLRVSSFFLFPLHPTERLPPRPPGGLLRLPPVPPRLLHLQIVAVVLAILLDPAIAGGSSRNCRANRSAGGGGWGLQVPRD